MKVSIALYNRKNGVKEAASRLAEMLSSYGAEASVFDNGDAALFESDPDFIVSLGGDGSLLHLARHALENGRDIPIVGINYGHTGYMSEIDFKKCKKEDLAPLFDGSAVTEERMVIRSEIVRDGKTLCKGYALNDVVVLRSRKAHVSEYVLSSEGKEITRFIADGIIFATPTGSTAYSLSAGGPIIDPVMRCLLVTPVCAHTLTARPIVFSEKTELCLKVSERTDSAIYLQNDGVTAAELKDGDEIRIKRSQKKIRLLKLDRRSFYGAVNAKLK